LPQTAEHSLRATALSLSCELLRLLFRRHFSLGGPWLRSQQAGRTTQFHQTAAPNDNVTSSVLTHWLVVNTLVKTNSTRNSPRISGFAKENGMSQRRPHGLSRAKCMVQSRETQTQRLPSSPPLTANSATSAESIVDRFRSEKFAAPPRRPNRLPLQVVGAQPCYSLKCLPTPTHISRLLLELGQVQVSLPKEITLSRKLTLSRLPLHPQAPLNCPSAHHRSSSPPFPVHGLRDVQLYRVAVLRPSG